MSPCKDITDEGARALAAAIIETACDDYVRSRKTAALNKNKSRAEQAAWEVEDILRFFHSNWYGTLCDLDPDILLEEMDRQVDEFIAAKKAQRRKP